MNIVGALYRNVTYSWQILQSRERNKRYSVLKRLRLHAKRRHARPTIWDNVQRGQRKGSWSAQSLAAFYATSLASERVNLLLQPLTDEESVCSDIGVCLVASR